MGSHDIIFIKELNDEGCWKLFKRLAFFNRSNEECEKLEEIGQRIVGKCKGLPLAVKTIGSLLRSKKTKQEWQVILNSEIWELEELQQWLLAPLLSSYKELPSMVKRCFQYCAIFPKDHQIKKDELIKLWMAQGYLCEKKNQEMEITGQLYFDILATRSFFQEFEKDKDDDNVIISCKMHDIVHDFAQYVCTQECFTREVNNCEESFKESCSGKVRHSMLMFGREIQAPFSFRRVKKLRSLLIYYGDDDTSSLNNVLLELFRKCTCLRALDINGSRFRGFRSSEVLKVPQELRKLIHLRYLNLSISKIKKLPDALCELYNLQTLDISFCGFLKELPQGIGKLINMRYLENKGTISCKYIPAGIAKLTNLQSLGRFIVGRDGSKTCTLESLKYLNLLQRCRIEGLLYVRNVGEVKRSRLEEKKNLLFLDLDFGYPRHFDEEELEVGRRNNVMVFKDLQLPLSLKKLEIRNYRCNTLFPSRLMPLTNLRKLCLIECSICEHLPPLGKLSSLEKLEIHIFKGVKRVGNEFLGILESDHHHGSSSSSSFSVIAFPKLKSLFVENMDELEEWKYENITGKGDIIIMPHLSLLKLSECPKLKTLPDQLLRKTTLQELIVLNCPVVEDGGQI